MNFTVAVTYSEVTPESAEDGDFSDAGYVDEAREFDSLRDLVDFIKREGFNQSSSYPVRRNNLPRWISTPFYVTDYSTGTEREESLHFGDMPERNVWRILRLAGIAR